MAEQLVSPAIRNWQRHAAVTALAELRGIERHEAARRILPDDPEAALKAAESIFERSAVSPASSTGWGSQTSQTRVETASFLHSLRPASAGASLLAKATQIDLGRYASAQLPRTLTDWPAPAWVDEGAPIPVQQGSLASDPLGPLKKLAAIAVLTNELSEVTGGAAEAAFSTLLVDAAGRALDASLFSNTAASSARPAGLLNGVTAQTAAGASGTLQDRALADVRSLVAAIAAGGGGGNIAFLAATAQAITLQATTNLPVIIAPSLTAGTLVAVDVGALAWAGDLPPKIETSRSAVVHMEDAAPAAIGTAGTPNVVAAPVRSLFQTDSLALKMELPITWLKRSATAVQYVSAVNW